MIRTSSFLCLSIVFGLSFSPTPSFAEGRCPPGMYPHDAPGVSACIPIPGAGPAARESPRSGPVRWRSAWGAIATSAEGTTDTGYANSESSEFSAHQNALAECEGRQGKRCKIFATYRDQCVAFTWGEGKGLAFASTAPDPMEAEGSAMTQCRNANGSDCTLLHSACAVPRAVY